MSSFGALNFWDIGQITVKSGKTAPLSPAICLALSMDYEHTCRVGILLSCLDGEVPVRAAKRRVRLKRE